MRPRCSKAWSTASATAPSKKRMPRICCTGKVERRKEEVERGKDARSRCWLLRTLHFVLSTFYFHLVGTRFDSFADGNLTRATGTRRGDAPGALVRALPAPERRMVGERAIQLRLVCSVLRSLPVLVTVGRQAGGPRPEAGGQRSEDNGSSDCDCYVVALVPDPLV